MDSATDRRLEAQRDERSADDRAVASVPASYAERAMNSLMSLHSSLVAEKERTLDLTRRLMEARQGRAELESYVRLLEAEVARLGGPDLRDAHDGRGDALGRASERILDAFRRGPAPAAPQPAAPVEAPPAVPPIASGAPAAPPSPSVAPAPREAAAPADATSAHPRPVPPPRPGRVQAHRVPRPPRPSRRYRTKITAPAAEARAGAEPEVPRVAPQPPRPGAEPAPVAPAGPAPAAAAEPPRENDGWRQW